MPQEPQQMNGFMDRKSLSLGPTCGSYDDRYFGPIIFDRLELCYLIRLSYSHANMHNKSLNSQFLTFPSENHSSNIFSTIK